MTTTVMTTTMTVMTMVMAMVGGTATAMTARK